MQPGVPFIILNTGAMIWWNRNKAAWNRHKNYFMLQTRSSDSLSLDCSFLHKQRNPHVTFSEPVVQTLDEFVGLTG